MAEKKFTDKLDSLNYVLGLNKANCFWQVGMRSFNYDLFFNDIKANYLGELPEVIPEEANLILGKFMEGANTNLSETNLFESHEFINHNGYKKDIKFIDFELQYNVLKKGRGSKPRLSETVKFHCHGRLIDETVFYFS